MNKSKENNIKPLLSSCIEIPMNIYEWKCLGVTSHKISWKSENAPNNFLCQKIKFINFEKTDNFSGIFILVILLVHPFFIASAYESSWVLNYFALSGTLASWDGCDEWWIANIFKIFDELLLIYFFFFIIFSSSNRIMRWPNFSL